MLKTGLPAPSIVLYNQRLERVDVADHQEKENVLLLFFPGAFSSVCTSELNEVNNDLVAFGPNTVIYGISTDSPFSLAEFKKVNGFRFSLLSDHDARVAAAFEAKYNQDFTAANLDRIAQRAAFVIDKAGILQYAEVSPHAKVLPDLTAIKALLNKLN